MVYSRVKRACDEMGISIYKLEKDLGFSPSSIVKWKVSIPTADKLKAVADYLKKPIEYFLEDEEKGTE